MNIDDLTVGQVKQLMAMVAPAQEAKPPHPMIGLYVIARCYAAGVHAGTVVSVDGENVILSNSRRLWSWKANDGLALSGLANNGLKDGKLDSLNATIYLTGVCELIPCSKKSENSINEK